MRRLRRFTKFHFKYDKFLLKKETNQNNLDINKFAYICVMDNFLDYKGIHPGIVLKRELEKRSLKQRPFALSIEEHPQTLNAITKGKRNMYTALALKIA